MHSVLDIIHSSNEQNFNNAFKVNVFDLTVSRDNLYPGISSDQYSSIYLLGGLRGRSERRGAIVVTDSRFSSGSTDRSG